MQARGAAQMSGSVYMPRHQARGSASLWEKLDVHPQGPLEGKLP